MAVKLKSVSTNQTLRLAFKAVVTSLVLYWAKSHGFGFGTALLFIVVFFAIYFRPALGNGRFAPSALTLFILPFFILPVSGGADMLFIVSWGLSLFILLGVKNLVLIKRQSAYRVVHFGIIAALGSLLMERPGLFSQAVMFVALLFVFREFYLTITSTDSEHSTLIAALEAFIFIELAWILSFLSTDILAGGAFLALFALIFHDTTTHKLAGTLERQIIIRNGALFGILTLAILILSARGAIM